MAKVRTLLKRLIRRILMNVWWTTFGAMLIPIGVVLMIAKPETAGASQWMVIVGFVFAIGGLALTFREDREKQKKERVRATKETLSLIMLTHIASALGVDMDEALRAEYELLLSDEKYISKDRVERKKND